MTLKEELFQCLKKEGAALMGIADLSDIHLFGEHPEASPVGEAFLKEGLRTGVSVAIPVPPAIVKTLETAPTREYYDTYYAMNHHLDQIVTAGAAFLTQKGFHAYANTVDKVIKGTHSISALPHKTVATRAGLGWIGKSCLLVTPQYGGAIRLSSLLTDAPLPCDVPIRESRCGNCHRCVDQCPGHALKGTLWYEGIDRSLILDWQTCKKAQLERMIAATGIHQDLCGKCFAVCPYTQRYIRNQ